MSADGTASRLSSRSNPSSSSSSGMDFEEALKIGGLILGALIALIAGHFLFFYILDLCINLDGGRRRRRIAQCFRTVFPFWNVRTQPNESNNNNDHAATTTPASLQQLQRENGEYDSRVLLSRDSLTDILPFRILSQHDVEKWESDHVQNNNNRSNKSDDEETGNSHVGGGNHSETHDVEGNTVHFPCSICLNEMREGEKVYQTKDCDHTFHYECFLQWVVSSFSMSTRSTGNTTRINLNCPNCRTQIPCLDCFKTDDAGQS